MAKIIRIIDKILDTLKFDHLETKNHLQKNINLKTKQLNPKLLTAIKAGRYFTVESLLKKGANINYCDRVGNSALHYAAIHNVNDKLSLLLLSYNPDYNKKNKNGINPLQLTLSHNNYSLAMELINRSTKKELNENLDKHGNSILHITCQYIYSNKLNRKLNHDVIELLLNKGIDPNIQNINGNTALHIAAMNKDNELIKLLLNNGADPNITNNLGMTFLNLSQEYVADLEQETYIKQPSSSYTAMLSKYNMLDKHAESSNIKSYFTASEQGVPFDTLNQVEKTNCDNPDIKTKLSTFAQPEKPITHHNSQKDSAFILPKSKNEKKYKENMSNFHLLHCIKANDYYSVKNAVDKADVNYEDENHKSCLYWAIKNKNFEIAELLLKKGAFVNHQDEFGNSCLHWAIQTGNFKIIKLLIANGAFLNIKANDNTMPIHFACYYGNAIIFQHLASQKGIQINIKDNYGHTPLHIAVEQGHKNIVSNILQRDIPLTTQDNKGRNIIHTTIETDNLSILILLLDKYNERKLLNNKEKDIINEQDNYGNTPLHLACHQGNIKTIKILLKYGADIKIVNRHKHTPLQVLKHFYTVKSSQLNILEKREIKNMISTLEKKNPSQNILLNKVSNFINKLNEKLM